MSSEVHPKIKERRQKVAGAKNKRKLRRKLYPPLIVLLLGGLALWLLFYSPFLDLNEVRVSGLANTDPQAISQITDQLLGDPLITANIDDARKHILELPWVQDVEISRSWGAGLLSVTILERTPIAVIATQGGYHLLDIEGKILATPTTPSNFPRIESSELTKTTTGWYEGAIPALAVAEELVKNPQVFSKVDSITLQGNDKLFLRLKTGGWVYLNDTRELDSKIRSIEAVLSQVPISCTEILDVNSPLSPVVTDSHDCLPI